LIYPVFSIDTIEIATPVEDDETWGASYAGVPASSVVNLQQTQRIQAAAIIETAMTTGIYVFFLMKIVLII